MSTVPSKLPSGLETNKLFPNRCRRELPKKHQTYPQNTVPNTTHTQATRRRGLERAHRPGPLEPRIKVRSPLHALLFPGGEDAKGRRTEKDWSRPSWGQNVGMGTRKQRPAQKTNSGRLRVVNAASLAGMYRTCLSSADSESVKGCATGGFE